MLNRELSLTFTSESDIIKLQRYELYDNRYRIFGNIASFMREVLFIVDFKKNVKRIWGTTTKKKIVISAAALAVVAAGGITTGVVVNHQKDSNQSITMDAEKTEQTSTSTSTTKATTTTTTTTTTTSTSTSETTTSTTEKPKEDAKDADNGNNDDEGYVETPVNDNTGSGNSGNTAAAQPSNSGGSSSSNNTPAPAPAPAPTPAPEPEPEPDVWHSPWEGTGNYNYAIGRGCDVYGADNYASLCSVLGSDRVSIGDPETGAGLSIWVLTDPDNGIWTRGGY